MSKATDLQTDDSSSQRGRIGGRTRQTLMPRTGPVVMLAGGLKTYWAVIAAVVSVVIAAVAWITLHVSPLDSYREIARKKEQQQFQRQLAQQHIELGVDFLNVGQLEAAKAEFAKAKELDPFSLDADLGLLKVSVFEPIAIKQYDPEIADHRLRAILKQRPHDTHALTYLAEVNRNIDQNEAFTSMRRRSRATPTTRTHTLAREWCWIFSNGQTRPSRCTRRHPRCLNGTRPFSTTSPINTIFAENTNVPKQYTCGYSTWMDAFF